MASKVATGSAGTLSGTLLEILLETL